MNLKLLAKLQKNKEKKVEERKIIKQWLIGSSTAANYTHEVTLTFPFDPKHIDTAEKMYGIFKKRLNERCFKRRGIENIKMAVVLEGEISGKRLHYHCAMRCPHHMTNDYFIRRIHKTWCDVVRSKYARVETKNYTNSEWGDYLLKEFDSRNTSVISEHTNF